MKKQIVKAYKVFNPDWTCRGFKFEVGKKYDTGKTPILCESGFHACIKVADCFNYYSFDSNNKVAEVELTGVIVGLDDGNKIASDKITIIKEISWNDVLNLVNLGKNNTGAWNTGHSNTGDSNTGAWNTGDRNTGNRNTGAWNTGNRNTGNRNTGAWNTGNRNTGAWNTGDSNTGAWNTGDSNTGHSNTGHSNTGDSNTGHSNTGDRNTGNWNTTNKETGFFNTTQSEFVNVFNKPCKFADWEISEKPNFLYFNLTEFISESKMTDSEKELNPKYKTLGGYLKKYDYKEAFQKSWDNASMEDRALLEKLPNFDWSVFTEISGIKKP